MKLSQSLPNQPQQLYCKYHPELFASSICKSPYCDYFRLLCSDCEANDHQHLKCHVTVKVAFADAIKMVGKIQVGLRAIKSRKQKEMELNISNNPGLAEIEQALEEIQGVINQKINQFKKRIRRIYSEHVKEKLDTLEEVIEKSEQFLEKNLRALKSGKQLSEFYRNDFGHQLAYYESYLTEVYVKNVRDFKTAIEKDNILALIVDFDQNLEKILTISRAKRTNQRNHLFHRDDQGFKRYEIKLNDKKEAELSIFKLHLQDLKISQQEEYKWDSSPNSIYSSQTSSFYFIGEGSEISRKIIKLEEVNSSNENQFMRFEDPQNNQVIKKHTLKLANKMKTQRKDFSISILKGEIYIVGGYNENEGCLFQCQKFNPAFNNQVYIVGSLNQRSAKHTVITYQEKYLLKFGGTDRPYENPLERPEIFPQIYSTETEEWAIINFQSTDQSIKFGYYPSVFCGLDQTIVIFGGQNTEIEKTKQRNIYKMRLQFMKKDLKQILIKTLNLEYPAKFEIRQSSIICLKQNKEEQSFIFMRRNQQEVNSSIELATLKVTLPF